MKIIQYVCLGMAVISSCAYGMQQDMDGIDGDWDIITSEQEDKMPLDRKKPGIEEVKVRRESLYSAVTHENYAADNKPPKKQTVASNKEGTLQSPRATRLSVMELLCLPCIVGCAKSNFDSDEDE